LQDEPCCTDAPDLDEWSSDPAGRSFAQAQLALYTTRKCRLSNSLADNPLIESAIYFLADAEGGHVRFVRQLQIFR
jgi:hypothetical protein